MNEIDEMTDNDNFVLVVSIVHNVAIVSNVLHDLFHPDHTPPPLGESR